MMNRFDHIESVYWVFTQLCNDQCDHCYNLSGPRGARLQDEEVLQIIDNLPQKMDRLILSGGEPLAERKQLFLLLDRVAERYGSSTQIMLQTNGDLMTGQILDTLLEKGVSRIDIASIDRYHKHAGKRIDQLKELFLSRGMTDDNTSPLIEKDTYLHKQSASFGFWGATEDMWLGGNWARGRAMEKDIWKKDPEHNFCNILSGAIGFLGGVDDIPQEISIQLWRINPCCPGTRFPLGDARTEKVADVLERIASNPVFQRLNEGDPWKMGESFGISEAYAHERTLALKNVCLWCDEFFETYLNPADFIPLQVIQPA
ncbi:MAG TPA: radical SAM protein [Bacteroidetes bacterium]|nr:radical SAM protein [Bacteroidota bacterium]